MRFGKEITFRCLRCDPETFHKHNQTDTQSRNDDTGHGL